MDDEETGLYKAEAADSSNPVEAAPASADEAAAGEEDEPSIFDDEEDNKLVPQPSTCKTPRPNSLDTTSTTTTTTSTITTDGLSKDPGPRRGPATALKVLVVFVIGVAVAVVLVVVRLVGQQAPPVDPTKDDLIVDDAPPTPVWWPRGPVIVDDTAASQGWGYTVAVAADGQRVAMGSLDGHLQVAQWNIDHAEWNFMATPFPETAAGAVTVALSADGRVLVAGVPGHEQGTGQVHIYELNNNNNDWRTLGDAPLLGWTAGDALGHAVAVSRLDDDSIIIALGAPQAHKRASEEGLDNLGHVQVWRWTTSQEWQIRGNVLWGAAAGSWFGAALALSDDANTLAVGAPLQMSSSKKQTGHVRLYKWNATDWHVSTTLAGRGHRDQFGAAVALNGPGTVLAVGAPHSDQNNNKSTHDDGTEPTHDGTETQEQRRRNVGRVYTYAESSASQWQRLVRPLVGTFAGDQLGNAVALSSSNDEPSLEGLILVVGAHSARAAAEEASVGQVRVFRLAADQTWMHVGPALEGGAAGDEFGFAVAVSRDGTVVAAGVPHADNQLNTSEDAGHVQIFVHDSSL